MEPRATTYVFDNCIVGDALMLDVHNFSTFLNTAARMWLKAAEGKETFKRNLQKVIDHYPRGLSPYITEVAVIG